MYIPIGLKDLPQIKNRWRIELPTDNYFVKTGGDKGNPPNCPPDGCYKDADCVECLPGVPPFDETRNREIHTGIHVFMPIQNCPACVSSANGCQTENMGASFAKEPCLAAANSNTVKAGQNCDASATTPMDWDTCGEYDLFVYFGIGKYYFLPSTKKKLFFFFFWGGGGCFIFSVLHMVTGKFVHKSLKAYFVLKETFLGPSGGH